VVNANFNNISVISWRPVLLVEETGVPDLLHVTDKLYHIMFSLGICVFVDIYIFLVSSNWVLAYNISIIKIKWCFMFNLLKND